MRPLDITVLKRITMDKTPLFVGDIHGEKDKLVELLIKAGFEYGDGELVSDTYELVSVGDQVDRGPNSKGVLDMRIKHAVLGNHDWKILRWLSGRDVVISHGSETTVAELQNISEEEKEDIIKYYTSLPLQLIINDKYLVVHGAMKDDHLDAKLKRAQKSCIYGLPTKELDENGLPIREEWWYNYTLPYVCIYGHTPQDDIFVYKNTVNIDTGCVFGGKLTAYDHENGIVYQV